VAVNGGETVRSAPRWTLSAAAFERLLALFGGEREAAGAAYEGVRRRLAQLFLWRGAEDPERLADLALDRVARRLEEGAQVTSGDPYGFVYGVARHVLQEHLRSPERRRRSTGELPALAAPEEAPLERAEELAEADLRLRCLRACLAELAPAERELLRRYHGVGARDRIALRRTQARELGLSPGLLRLRAHRLRGALHACIDGCEAHRRRGAKWPAPNRHESPERNRAR
jgi:DNA-directed RNA polymerase specialized sigma24 family protein